MADLNEILFETLQTLKDDEKPLDILRATQINKTAQTIIALGKLEIEFIKATGQKPEGHLFNKRLSAGSTNGKDSNR
jgi:hypothetical protein